MPSPLPSQRRVRPVPLGQERQASVACRSVVVRQRWLIADWFVCFFLALCTGVGAQPSDFITGKAPQDVLDSLAQDLNWSEPTREAYNTIFSENPSATVEDVVLRLLNVRENGIRRNALEAVTRIVPNRIILKQISMLADRDPDALCQAKARLILAEYSSGIDDIPASDSSHPPLRPKILGALPSASGNRVSRDSRSIEPARYLPLDDADLEVMSPLPDSGERSRLQRRALRTTSVLEEVNYSELDLPTEPRTLLPEADANVFDHDHDAADGVEPRVMERPLGEPDDVFTQTEAPSPWPVHPIEAPLGFTGPSGILPIDGQEDGHFVPQPDRWRAGFPTWDRYKQGHPRGVDYPYQEGHWWDPYNLNVLKGDYPIIGQHTFLKFTGRLDSLQEYRQLPTSATSFESTAKAGEYQFFGNPNQYFTTNFFRLSAELFHGNTSFKPVDWTVRLTPVFNINYLDVAEVGIVNPNVNEGTTRFDSFMALEEYFVEAKLKDLSPDYDFMSMRVGSQQFTSDFRGFIFSDTNRAIRLFGTRLANRDQFNVAYFRQAEKDTNSQLNTFADRNQNIFIANYFRQDFLFPGYTAQWSVHYNNDGPSVKYDTEGVIVRPDPVGTARPHRIDSVYLGMTGDGHIGRLNLTNAFYWVTGRDSLNPIAGTPQTISAEMAAAELSYDRDWVRFRTSIFYASGDRNPYNNTATGFDSILDNPNFAGGQFSYWQRQQLMLNGVGLVNRFSLVPDLRSSKFQGQSNFVNPGLRLFNIGADFELTPKARLITNANYLEFDSTRVLEAFTFQSHINRTIGVDLSLGVEYRPLLNDNVILTAGYACLVPGAGLKDLFGAASPFTTANARSIQLGVLNSAFAQLVLQF